jgi:hypothetical protein
MSAARSQPFHAHQAAEPDCVRSHSQRSRSAQPVEPHRSTQRLARRDRLPLSPGLQLLLAIGKVVSPLATHEFLRRLTPNHSSLIIGGIGEKSVVRFCLGKNQSETLRLHFASDSLNPDRYSVAIKCVRKEDSERSPDEPDQFAEVQIVVSPVHFQWLTKQSEFLGVTKQELIAGVLEEWIRRNRSVRIPLLEASAMVRWALDEFMQRHRDEFLPLDGES